MNNTNLYYELHSFNKNDNFIKSSCDFLDYEIFKKELTPYEQILLLYMKRQLYSKGINRMNIIHNGGYLNKYINFAATKMKQDGMNINKNDIKNILFTFSLAERKELNMFTNQTQFIKAKNKLIKYGFIGEIKLNNPNKNNNMINLYYISDKYKRNNNLLDKVIKDNNAAEQDTRNEQDKVI